MSDEVTYLEGEQAGVDAPDGEGGQGMVEYAVIVALVAVAAMVATQMLGSGIVGVFTRVVTKLGPIG